MLGWELIRISSGLCKSNPPDKIEILKSNISIGRAADNVIKFFTLPFIIFYECLYFQDIIFSSAYISKKHALLVWIDNIGAVNFMSSHKFAPIIIYLHYDYKMNI